MANQNSDNPDLAPSSGSETAPPAAGTSHGALPANVTYTVDALDRIQAMGGDWDRFARDNQGEHLIGPGVLGRSIWDFLGSPDVKGVYRALFTQARNETETIRMPFRCDSPEELRELELTIKPEADGSLAVTSRTLRVQPRSHPVHLLDSRLPRTSELLSMCAWCKRVSMEGEWWDLDDAVAHFRILDDVPLPGVTHGICPTCDDSMM